MMDWKERLRLASQKPEYQILDGIADLLGIQKWRLNPDVPKLTVALRGDWTIWLRVNLQEQTLEFTKGNSKPIHAISLADPKGFTRAKLREAIKQAKLNAYAGSGR